MMAEVGGWGRIGVGSRQMRKGSKEITVAEKLRSEAGHCSSLSSFDPTGGFPLLESAGEETKTQPSLWTVLLGVAAGGQN